MRVAVIGSRGLEVDLEPFMPEGCSEIITGGARGIDQCAARYARAMSIPLREIRPDYKRFGRGAPLRRNDEIIDAADLVIAIWDGKSPGTDYVIRRCREKNKTIQVYTPK